MRKLTWCLAGFVLMMISATWANAGALECGPECTDPPIIGDTPPPNPFHKTSDGEFYGGVTILGTSANEPLIYDVWGRDFTVDTDMNGVGWQAYVGYQHNQRRTFVAIELAFGDLNVSGTEDCRFDIRFCDQEVGFFAEGKARGGAKLGPVDLGLATGVGLSQVGGKVRTNPSNTIRPDALEWGPHFMIGADVTWRISNRFGIRCEAARRFHASFSDTFREGRYNETASSSDVIATTSAGCGVNGRF